MGSTSDGDRPWQSYHTVFTNAKAGMDGVDKEKVQRVVYEMSKGSKYFENEKRKEAFTKLRIEKMRTQCAQLTAKDIAHFQMIADRKISELEASRDLSKIWLHSDMDAFYAAVETLEDPSLKGKPLAVGSISMICTASYEARKFGVRAAMPGFIARKLCPDLIFVPTNFGKYTYYSEMTRKVFQKYDPCFIATSLDEAYLDITDICKERGVSGDEIAAELRNAIYEETGLTCSAGVAPNRLLAKVCSDINKPNGQFILPNDRGPVITFISSLPIRKIGGIGKVTEHVLRDVLGVNTCEEMLQKSAFLCALFSPCSTDFFLSVGLGLGNTDTPQSRSRKSMSSERTFLGTEDESLLYQKLADIAETLSMDMKKESLCGRTLTLKLKTASFEVRTRAVSLQKYIQSKEDILSHATKLLKAELPLSLRLIGLRMSQFRDDKPGSVDPMQKTLTSFIISGDASPNIMYHSSSTGSEVYDDQLMHDGEMNSLIGNEIFFSDYINDPSAESNHPDLASSSEADERQKNNDMDSSSKFVIPCSSDHVRQYDDIDADKLQMLEAETSSTSKQFTINGLDEVNKISNAFDNKKLITSTQELVFWIDDYICSICGSELPLSFVEERQEHADYHLAEMLQQKEDAMDNSRNLTQKKRTVQKAWQTRESMHKKHRSSPKDNKHLPIDLFFIKSNK